MKHRAFSLIELIMTLAVLGLLGSLTVVSIGHVSERSARQKLVSDVNTLNRAVSSYLAMGGSLAGASSPAEVIARLKSRTSAEASRRKTGLSSSFVDSRLGVELSSDQKGVIWDANRGRFLLDGSGVGAVAAFTLDDALAENPATEETRSGAFSYAKDSAWIWDYHDRPIPAEPGVTQFVVESVTDPSPLPAPTVAVNPVRSLTPPRFSQPAGTYDFRAFDLPIALSNQNPLGSSKIVYAIDFGQWQDYTGPVQVAPGSVLSAETVSLTSRWGDSGKIDQRYDAEPVALAAPTIAPNSESFGMFFHREVEVTLFNPNPSESSRLEYRVAGGAWTPYALPIRLQRTDFASVADIEARAVPQDSPYYLDSSIATRSIPVDPFEASGETAGQFANAQGQSRMVTNLENGDPSETFAWGDLLPVGDSRRTDQSQLAFQGTQFAEVGPGEAFQIGMLSYYNGTILAATGADRIDLTIRLDLTINGIAFRPDFTFSFDLINTANTNDAWASADYVRIADSVASQSLVVNDYEYQFQIEFGRTTSAGYAVFDEFHVLENAGALAEIYGTLIEMGQVAR